MGTCSETETNTELIVGFPMLFVWNIVFSMVALTRKTISPFGFLLPKKKFKFLPRPSSPLTNSNTTVAHWLQKLSFLDLRYKKYPTILIWALLCNQWDWTQQTITWDSNKLTNTTPEQLWSRYNVKHSEKGRAHDTAP